MSLGHAASTCNTRKACDTRYQSDPGQRTMRLHSVMLQSFDKMQQTYGKLNHMCIYPRLELMLMVQRLGEEALRWQPPAPPSYTQH